MFKSEICHSSCAKLNKQEKREPKNRVSDKFVIRNWCRGFIFMPSLHSLSSVSEPELATTGVPLLHCTSSGDESRDKFYSVQAAHFPIFPFQKSFQSIPFLLTEYSMKLFIADSIFSLILRDRDKDIELNDINLSWENTADLITKTSTITEAFKQKGQHTINPRKMCERRFHCLTWVQEHFYVLNERYWKKHWDMSLPR